jgi:SAM-dependent methyltransferase
MLEVTRQNTPGEMSFLDFGCGASHLYEYILEHNIDHIRYSGLDISEKFVTLSRRKFPAIDYYHLDILEDANGLPEFDYIVMNGVFTEKCDLDFDVMLSFFMRVVKRIFSKARVGIAFNVMSSHVDWEREDLFHLPMDTLAAFVIEELTRNFVIRNDYGLYEYTTYVYRRPQEWQR